MKIKISQTILGQGSAVCQKLCKLIHASEIRRPSTALARLMFINGKPHC